MAISNLQIWAEEIAKEKDFIIDKLIYTGTYYETGHVRDVIFTGTYKGKEAALKAYDDPRMTDEPLSLKAFHEHNKSESLTAPELYAYEVISPHKSWFIMEKLSAGGTFFKSPMDREERQEFIKAFLEYRRNFPLHPNRELRLDENLPAHEFHLFRINRWFELANNKEEERVMAGKERILKPGEFIPRYKKGIEIIRAEFLKRKMVWLHGHFKPKEIYKVSNSNRKYLTDFAHTKMYPEGYEFGFIVWSDCLMPTDWKMDYKDWREGVFSWISDFKPVACELKIEKFNSLARASIIERIFGAILADICAADGEEEEKKKRIALLYKLFDELSCK